MPVCYFVKTLPTVDIGDEHIFITPDHGEFEAAITPHLLQKLVAKYNRVLDEWHARKGAKVVRLPISGPREVKGSG